MSVETIGEKYMIKETLIKIKKEWPVWSLYHREYIIGFVLGVGLMGLLSIIF